MIYCSVMWYLKIWETRKRKEVFSPIVQELIFSIKIDNVGKVAEM